MDLEHLSHKPEFELPSNWPGATTDLISLIEECHEGLHRANVHKMVARGKYEQIAIITCQENASIKTRPIATADDIAEYCMACMQYDVEKNDEPATYRVQLIGPPGKGRFERSKHVDLTGGDGAARSKTMITEGDLIEQQSQYIGELHAQNVALNDSVQSVIKPILARYEELTKVVHDCLRKTAEVERDRMRHELELRMHNDEVKIEEMKEEAKNERWKETIEVVKETGMVEGFMKAIIKKIGGDEFDDDEDEDDDDDEKPKKKATKKPIAPKTSSDKKKETNGKSRVAMAKGKKKGDKKKPPKKKESSLSEKTQEALESGDDLTEEQLKEVFEASAVEKMQEHPHALMVEILKMSIDENDQWGVVEETLSEEQFALFKKITKAKTDTKVRRLLRRLYEMKGARRLIKLEDHLDADQAKLVEKLMAFALKKKKKKRPAEAGANV